MKFSRIISLMGGEKVFSLVDNSPRGFDNARKRRPFRYFRDAVGKGEKRD